MSGFDMEFDEAMAEAIDQFVAQGVDLRNIKKDNPETRENVSLGIKAACDTIRECVHETEAADLNAEGHRVVTEDVKAKVLAAIADLHSEAEISDERRSAARDEGAIGIL